MKSWIKETLHISSRSYIVNHLVENEKSERISIKSVVRFFISICALLVVIFFIAIITHQKQVNRNLAFVRALSKSECGFQEIIRGLVHNPNDEKSKVRTGEFPW